MVSLRRSLPVIICLLILWVLVSLGIHWIQSRKPSGADALALLDRRPDRDAPAEARRAWIAQFCSRLAPLDLDSRHRVLMDPRLGAVFSEWPNGEQEIFLKTSEPHLMAEFIEGSKGWNPGRYDRLTRLSLADLEALQPGSEARLRPFLADPRDELIWKAGVLSLLVNTDPMTIFETRPLIERIQKYSQMGR